MSLLDNDPPAAPDTFADYAGAMAAGRQRLGNHLPPHLFADPALDILLDLFIAGERGEMRQVKSCILAARVPTSTAWRCLRSLETEALVERDRDDDDHRMIHVRLSPNGRTAIRSWLAAISPVPLKPDFYHRQMTIS